MKKNLLILVVLFLSLTGFSFADTSILEPDVKAHPSVSTVKNDNFNYGLYQKVNPLDIVARPSFYLNKNVNITGKFDKFSTLGLDYEPAMKSSEKYISFLIQRPDVNDHNIPLSEMKCFLSRDDAEKFIDLNSGDRVEFWGTVFSNALGDVWIDVKKFDSLDKSVSKN